MSNTLLLSHPALLDHGRPSHPENSTRLKTILSSVEQEADQEIELKVQKIDRMAAREELLLVHGAAYVDHVIAQDGKDFDLDPETPMTPGSVKAARLAAGLGIELVERIIEGKVKNGFLLARPPGHHARPNQGMGFCIFNNIAIAARKAINLGINRVLILDWDVHHGNGTQEAFYEDGNVLFIDLHQDDLFPKQSGLLAEHGTGKGLGLTVNVPLPHSCKDVDYFYVFEKLVRPLASKFQPELILVSAGFDAHERDPLGSMRVTTSGFGRLTQKIKALADELCGGKLALFLEGGYDPHDLAKNVIQCSLELSSAVGSSAAGSSAAGSSATSSQPNLEEVAILVQRILDLRSALGIQ